MHAHLTGDLTHRPIRHQHQSDSLTPELWATWLAPARIFLRAQLLLLPADRDGCVARLCVVDADDLGQAIRPLSPEPRHTLHFVPTVEEYTAERANELFGSWPIGDELDDVAMLRPLLRGIDGLIQRGLHEQCSGWPQEWSTDGIFPARCIRTGARTVEVIGLCWSFTAGRGGIGRFPIRASLAIDDDGYDLVFFHCDIGEFDALRDRPPEFPEGSMILFPTEEDTETPGPHVLVGRRTHPIVWTPVISYPPRRTTDHT